jgi:hypothetical protein
MNDWLVKLGVTTVTIGLCAASVACGGSSGEGSKPSDNSDGTGNQSGSSGNTTGSGNGTGSDGSGVQTSSSVPGVVADNPGGTWTVPPEASGTKKPGKDPKGGDTEGTGGTGATDGSGGTASITCTPGVEEAIVTDCGYPFESSNPLTNVEFNESEVLRAIRPSIAENSGVVSLLYGDEHTMVLGVHQVVVTGAGADSTKDFAVSPMTKNPDSILDPLTGTNALTGDNSGLDQSGRPLWPVLYVTDITTDATSRAGDWQMGGRPINPNAVFGTWKGAVRTVDKSTSPPTVSITPDVDTEKNDYNLGIDDVVPDGIKNEGWGAEVRWGVQFRYGHRYRLQVIVHDGDQNKVGGDCGEGCIVYCPGGENIPYPPPPNCTPCGEGAAEDGGYLECAEGQSCVNGCCQDLECPAGSDPCGAIGADGAEVGCSEGLSCVSGCCVAIL